jgi:hypothetical protein
MSPAVTVPTHYDEVALTLVDNGWPPVPLHPQTKVPTRRGWPHRALMTPERLRPEVMRELSWRGGADRRHCACGIAVPAITLGIDCDLTETEANDKVRCILHETLGAPTMARIGNLPKWMAVYGAAPGIYSRKLGGVELFCGTGQIAAFGMHATTGRPYYWSKRSPLNTRPDELRRVTKRQVDAFVAALLAENVLQPRQRKVHGKGTPDVSPQAPHAGVVHGRYPATERLHALLGDCGGLVKPAVARLIADTGQAGHDRHNCIVAVCGYLVHVRWLNDQISEFLVPLANDHFSDGDWSFEVARATAHARNRTAARLLAAHGMLGGVR